MDLVLILELIVALATLITWFKLCKDVSNIKRKLNNDGGDSFKTAFLLNVAFHREEEAKSMLMEKIRNFDYFCQEALSDDTSDQVQDAREKIDREFGFYLKMLNIKIDYTKIDEAYGRNKS